MKEIRFETLADYMEAFSKNPDLAVIPTPLVAEHLGRTPPAVTAMIRTGKLDEIQIGKNKFIALRSLMELEKAFQRQVDIVEQYLRDLVKEGRRSVFYEPIMTKVGMDPAIPADRTKIGEILGEVSRRSMKRDGVLLSVLVHRKSAGNTGPGPGFFKLAAELGCSWTDDNAFVEEQTELVIKKYS